MRKFVFLITLTSILGLSTSCANETQKEEREEREERYDYYDPMRPYL
jgi:hypothetical protein